MFAAVEVCVPKKRLRLRRRKEEPQLRQIRFDSGMPHYVITAEKHKQGVDWQAIARKAGNFSQKLLLPANLELPEESRCRPLQCEKLGQKLLLNTALRLIKQCAFIPQETSITVLDSRGNMAAEMRQFVPLAATVRVVTRRPERYSHLMQALMDEFGATLLVTDAPNAAQGSSFIIALDEDCPLFAGDSIIISQHKSDCGRFAVTAGGFVLPDAYKEVMPKGADPYAYAAALYELCAVAPLGQLQYTTCALCGTAMPLETIAQQLQQARYRFLC